MLDDFDVNGTEIWFILFIKTKYNIVFKSNKIIP